MLLWIIIASGFLVILASGCGYPGSPAHASISFSTERVFPGTIATYHCDRGFELLGPPRRLCNENGTWTPLGIPFCVLNVAVGKAPMQSSSALGGPPQKAIDGSTSSTPNADTCSMTLTEVERPPWWYVNLLEPYMVQLVRVDFGRPCCANNVPATVVVRVGNNRPDVNVNPICSRYIGPIEVGRPLFLPCTPPMLGAFVSIHLEGPPGNPLSICEAFVYTDQAVPLESCPSFRDQPPGSSATFNGKCYIFYNNQPTTFEGARRVCESRGGSLVDETSPVLQGFLSWELWQRHRSDPSGQYWMGATRDKQNPNNWKWISGNDVTVSYWTLPGGNENCSRFDGTRGWLWSDTNCLLNLNFVCQHKPLSCGHPEQPPNSTLTVTSREFVPGTTVRYMCNPGDLLIGPEKRVCQQTGYYNEYPPKCRHLECGSPADIPNGGFRLVNGTQFYMSMVQYFCHEGYSLVGRGDLICDVDEKWDGPPPRCESMTCPPPPLIQNGFFTSSTNVTVTGTTVTYYCTSPSAMLIGSQSITCTPNGHWSSDPPHCIAASARPPASVGGERISGIGPSPFNPPHLPPNPHPPPPPPPASVSNDVPNSDKFIPISSLLDWFTVAPTRQPPPALPEVLPPALPPPRAPPANFFPPLPPPNRMNFPEPPVPLPPTTLIPPTELPSEVVHTGIPGIHIPEISPSTSASTTTTEFITKLPPSTTTTTTTTTTHPPTTSTTVATSTITTTIYTTRETTVPSTSIAPTTTLSSTTTPSTTTTTTTTIPYMPPSDPPPFDPPFFRTAPPAHALPGGTSSSHPFYIHEQPSTFPSQLRNRGAVNVQNVTSGTKESSNGDMSTSNQMRLNTGGIIALSVFGGFVILAAIITIIVIIYRRKRRPRGSMDNITISTYDSGSGSEHGGLSKYYKRAWENLRMDKGLPIHLGDNGDKGGHASRHAPAGRQETLDNPNYRAGRGSSYEGMRDSNEMTVSDSAAWRTRRERKSRPHQNHHHHHHHHHNSRNHGNNKSDDQDRGEYRPWYRLHRN